MSSKPYEDGTMFEFFVKRAYQTYESNSRIGADSSIMRNLITAEDGTFLNKYSGSFVKQFDRARNIISKSIAKFLKMKLTQPERETLIGLQFSLRTLSTSDELMKVVYKVLDITERYKEY